MPRKSTAKKSDIEVKKTETKAVHTTEKSETVPTNASSWECKLLEVYGGTTMLRYRPIEPGMATMDYELTPKKFFLQNGFAIEPGSMGGQVSSSFMSATDSTVNTIYTGLGGQVELTPPNLGGITVDGELATVNIVAYDVSMPSNIALPSTTLSEMKEQKLPSNYSLTEISAYVKASMVIEPVEGFKMELGEGEYVKRITDFDPKLTFWRTKLTYRNKPVAPAFETESDSSGLHISGDHSVELDTKVMGGIALAKSDDASPQLYMVMDELGARVEERTAPVPKPEDPKNDYLIIGDAKFYLENIKRDSGVIIAADRATCVYNGFDITLTDVVVEDQQSRLSGKTESITMMTGKSTITCNSLSFDAVAGLHAQQATLTRDGQEYFLESVRFAVAECVHAEQAQGLVEGYRTTMRNVVFETRGALSYEGAEVLTVLHYGLNKEKKDEYNENAQNFFAFSLESGSISNGKFDGSTASTQTASQEKTTIVDAKTKNKQKTVVIDREIFTEDGFVQLEDAIFDFKKDGDSDAGISGKGKFKFLAVPYVINLSGGRTVKGETQAKDDAEEDALEFTIGESGNIDAEFDNDIELNMLKASNGTENLIRSLTLSKVAIKESLLTAQKVRLDRGINFEQSVEDATESEMAQKLFGGEIKGTISRSGLVNKIDREGIQADALENHLGKFGVSGFLGFLDVEGDYPAGKLHAALKKETEKEGDQAKLFSSAAQNIMTDDGLNIPIAGPLAFKFSISPSVSIGGELSADLDRGKSFGEEMTPGESLKLEGQLQAEGKGSLGLSAGLAIGIPVITNLAGADVKLNAELEATIKAALKAKTALGKPQEKLKQAEDLEMSGKVDAGLSGAVSLSSDVKFLIWKAQVFKIELFKKEVKLTPFSGTAKRDKDAHGLKEGWHFESLDLSADAFGKKAFLTLRNAEKDPAPAESLEMSKEAAESLGNEAKSAWTVLQELKERQSLSKDRAYIISEEEKQLLDSRIRSMTATVREKLTEYLSKLNRYVSLLEGEAREAENEVDKARKAQYKYQNDDEIRQSTMRNAEAGGFKFKLYEQITPTVNPEIQKNNPKRYEKEMKKQEKAVGEENTRRRKMAAIDLAIARVLGIYSISMNAAKDDYDFYAQKQNMLIPAKNQKIREKNKANGTNYEEEKLYRRINEMSEADFLFGYHGTWGRGMSMLEYVTSFGATGDFNYFRSLYQSALDIKGERKIDGFGSIYEPIFRCMPNLSGFEFLKIVLSDTYPSGVKTKKGVILGNTPIKATPKEKLQAFKYLFHQKNTKNTVDTFLNSLIGLEVKEKNKQKDMLSDADEVYNALFQSGLEHMTTNGNVDMAQKFRELDQNLLNSKEKYLKTLEVQVEAQNAVQTVNVQIEDCKQKLRELGENVQTATSLQGNAVSGATAAVNFMQNEYQNIASTQTLTEAIIKTSQNPTLQQKAKQLQSTVGRMSVQSSGRTVMPSVNRQ